MGARQRVATVGYATYFLCSFWSGAAPVAAHGPIHEQIALLTARIQEDPQNATLYLRRGELHGLHEDWDAALADYDRAAQLSPPLAAVDLARGKTLLRAGRFRPAKEALDRFLTGRPHHPDALLARARVLSELSESRAAARDYGRAIAGWEQLGQPKPEYYLEWARALTALGEDGQALRALDAGIEELGSIVSLQLPAIEIELTRGQYDAALTRLSTVASRSPSAAPWLARRGKILERAGRPAEARAVYEEALAGLEQFPRTRRLTELESEVRAALARLRPVSSRPGRPVKPTKDGKQ